MKKYFAKLMMGLGIVAGGFMIACDDIDPAIDSLNFDRLFAPIGVEASITNNINVNLSWKTVQGAESYIVEIYKDSLLFDAANLVYRGETTDTKFTYTLQSDTRYSAQIKAVSSSTNESKWYNITFLTEVPDIYLASEIGDLGADFATLRWPVEAIATKISLSPASSSSGIAVSRSLTDTEIASGIAKVEGLTPGNRYNAILYSGTQKISKREITTLNDGTIVLDPSDDLLAEIANAKSGATLLLKPGEYLSGGSRVTIDKNLTITSYGENYRPVIHAHFDVGVINSFTLKDVTLEGTKSSGVLDNVIQFSTAGNIGTITMDGCRIDNYNKSFISAVSPAIKVESIVINNSVISNVLTNSADFIDIRGGLIKNLALTNSTFYNCAPARDFIRLDETSSTFPSQTSNVVINNCTLDGVANSTSRSILCVRFTTNVMTVSNSIITNTAGTFARYALSSQPICSKNNYFNASGLLVGGSTIADAKFDISGTQTTLDPGYANAAAGDFTVTNKSVTVGDPRWIK
ncbi:MAG: DUF4957 domain-containing protein [Dysgonomonas sp.]